MTPFKITFILILIGNVGSYQMPDARRSLTLPRTFVFSGNTMSLECHFGKEERYRSSGEVREQSSGRIECNQKSELCARTHFRGVDKEDGRLVTGHHASCLNASECIDSRSCALNRLKDLSVGDNVEITRCKTVCCEGNMCNHHNKERVEHDESTSEQLQCYVGYIFFDSNGAVQEKEVNAQTCGYSSSPCRLDRSSRCSTAELTETNVHTQEVIVSTVFRCADANMCINTCDTYVAANKDPEIEVSCKAQCCRNHLCNSSSTLHLSMLLLTISMLTRALLVHYIQEQNVLG